MICIVHIKGKFDFTFGVEQKVEIVTCVWKSDATFGFIKTGIYLLIIIRTAILLDAWISLRIEVVFATYWFRIFPYLISTNEQRDICTGIVLVLSTLFWNTCIAGNLKSLSTSSIATYATLCISLAFPNSQENQAC